jgi:hypothetical protein
VPINVVPNSVVLRCARALAVRAARLAKYMALCCCNHGSAVLINGTASARMSGRTPVPTLCFVRPTRGPMSPEHHQHRDEGGRGRRLPASLVQKDSRRALAVASYRMPSQCLEEEQISRQGSRRRVGRCNNRSTFKTSRCNTYNIRLKTDESLETCV